MLSRPASRALSRPHALRNSSSLLLRAPLIPRRRRGAEFLRACSSQPSSSAEPDGVVDGHALRMVALQASLPFVGFGFRPAKRACADRRGGDGPFSFAKGPLHARSG